MTRASGRRDETQPMVTRCSAHVLAPNLTSKDACSLAPASPVPTPLSSPSPPKIGMRYARLGSVVVVEEALVRLLAATTLGRRHATKEAPAARVVIVVAKEAWLLSSGPGSGL